MDKKHCLLKWIIIGHEAENLIGKIGGKIKNYWSSKTCEKLWLQ